MGALLAAYVSRVTEVLFEKRERNTHNDRHEHACHLIRQLGDWRLGRACLLYQTDNLTQVRPPAFSAPRCAAPSLPSAMPLTVIMPARASVVPI